MSELSDDTILYRAIRKKGWIDPDTKEVDPEAFLLRPQERGLSANLTPYPRLLGSPDLPSPSTTLWDRVAEGGLPHD